LRLEQSLQARLLGLGAAKINRHVRKGFGIVDQSLIHRGLCQRMHASSDGRHTGLLDRLGDSVLNHGLRLDSR
jgi:hypothetical protein